MAAALRVFGAGYADVAWGGESVMEIISDFFFGTIWGGAVIAAIAYGVAWLLGRLLKRSLFPEAVFAVVIIACFATFPSIPRYQFESDVRDKLKKAPWARVIEEVRWGDVTEPLTWFSTPVGHFKIASPDPITIDRFNISIVQFNTGEPTPHIIDVYCESKTYSDSVPDNEGVFRVLPNDVEMTKLEYREYCETRWETERQALRDMLKNR